MGLPLLLPTPPFTIGEELDFDPITYANFAGYDQKLYLLKVQKAIIRYVIEEPANFLLEQTASKGCAALDFD